MRRGLLLAVLWMGYGLPRVDATELTIAAASNLAGVMPELAEAFTARHPGIKVQHALASSGSLVAQISHGAPFDILLAADLQYPRRLIELGLADATSLRVFAHGQLILWPAPPDSNADWQAHLLSDEVRRIAIANPDTAPFGAAAREALVGAGLWARLESKIVIGENVAQALQFVHSGNAQVGLVAASLVVSLDDSREGMLLGDEHLFPMLAHGAVLLTRTKERAAARAFLEWLGTEDAQMLLQSHGYRTDQAVDTSPSRKPAPDA